MFTKRRFFLLILIISGIIASAQAAKVYGTIYEWSGLETPLKNTIVEVNSTPSQYVVSTTGAYSFNLSPGDYLIKAKYYRNNILEYAAEDEIRIDREGDFIHDLLLFPPTESEYEYLGDINLTGDLELKAESDLKYYLIILIVFLLSLFIIYWMKKKKNMPIETAAKETTVIPPENIAKTESTELPEDLREIYGLILKKGGRVTQKELRKEVKYGEAKVSLLIADLDNRGLIKKFKKGRANIIIAEAKK